MHETTKALLASIRALDVARDTPALPMAECDFESARREWLIKGCHDLEPDECPEGWVDVPVVIGVSRDGCFAACEDLGPGAASLTGSDQVNESLAWAGTDDWRLSTVTVRAPKPAPIADLGTVTAKEA